jgi:hypothetical protein
MLTPRRLLPSLLVFAAGCTPPPAACPGPPVGTSLRPFEGTPEYFMAREPPPTGPVGRYSDRVPVAGPAPIAPPPQVRDRLDAVRSRLAEIDLLVVEMRAHHGSDADAVNELRRKTAELAPLVAARPDLAGAVGELDDLSRRLLVDAGVAREQVLARLEQLTDLMRTQITATL